MKDSYPAAIITNAMLALNQTYAMSSIDKFSQVLPEPC
jgi:hypothetical protein